MSAMKRMLERMATFTPYYDWFDEIEGLRAAKDIDEIACWNCSEYVGWSSMYGFRTFWADSREPDTRYALCEGCYLDIHDSAP